MHELGVCMNWVYAWITLLGVSFNYMGWLRWVGSLKLQVSCAKELYKRAFILQKKPVIWRGLLIVATPSRDAVPPYLQLAVGVFLQKRRNVALLRIPCGLLWSMVFNVIVSAQEMCQISGGITIWGRKCRNKKPDALASSAVLPLRPQSDVFSSSHWQKPFSPLSPKRKQHEGLWGGYD